VKLFFGLTNKTVVDFNWLRQLSRHNIMNTD